MLRTIVVAGTILLCIGSHRKFLRAADGNRLGIFLRHMEIQFYPAVVLNMGKHRISRYNRTRINMYDPQLTTEWSSDPCFIY